MFTFKGILPTSQIYKYLNRHLNTSRCLMRTVAVNAVKPQPIGKVLIANRGEIACRVMRTARKLGLKTVAVYSDPDRTALHVNLADEAYNIGGAAPQESYLKGNTILDVALKSGAHAIHPGYGFLSENTEFAEACKDKGVIFVGPPSQAIRDMGIKSTSKHIMEAAGVPIVGGYHGEDQSDERLRAAADTIGFPVMIKAVRGGGGKGMRISMTPDDFKQQLDSAKREAIKSFNDDVMLIEKYVERPRHVEVQVFGDTHGNYVYLYERDCSVQRRHQKIVEEAPAPGLSWEVRKKLGDAAVQAARAVNYVGAGTVEFIMDQDQKFYFMEMNTRLQVEHPVSEMITGTDLVEWQLRVASGEPLPLSQEQLQLSGHSFEARVYAEEPGNSFMPGAGPITRLNTPIAGNDIRIETGVREGDEVSVHYDPMIAKVVVWGEDRNTALLKMTQALQDYNVVGLHTNVNFMLALLKHPQFISGNVHTDFIPEHHDQLFPDYKVTDELISMAALALLLSGRNAQDSTPFSQNLNYSKVNQAPSSKLDITPDGAKESVRVEVSDNAVSVGGRTLAASGRLTTDAGVQELVTEIEGVITRTRVIIDGQSVFLFIKDGVRKFSLPPPKFVSKVGGGMSAGGGGGAVAPMPGVVEKIMVEQGAKVEAGDPLVVIIAMKMEFVVKAAEAGTVKSVLYKKGDTVGKDAPLVTITPHQEAAEE